MEKSSIFNSEEKVNNNYALHFSNFNRILSAGLSVVGEKPATSKVHLIKPEVRTDLTGFYVEVDVNFFPSVYLNVPKAPTAQNKFFINVLNGEIYAGDNENLVGQPSTNLAQLELDGYPLLFDNLTTGGKIHLLAVEGKVQFANCSITLDGGNLTVIPIDKDKFTIESHLVYQFNEEGTLNNDVLNEIIYHQFNLI